MPYLRHALNSERGENVAFFNDTWGENPSASRKSLLTVNENVNLNRRNRHGKMKPRTNRRKNYDKFSLNHALPSD